MRKLILIVLILFPACEKSEITDITSQCEFYGCGYLGKCFGNWHGEIVIRNQEEFQRVGDSVRIHPVNINCDTAQLPEIDFDHYSLIGKFTIGGGCGCQYFRRVLEDQQNDHVIYEINNRYYGECKVLIIDMNWALVPRIPDHYTVKFVLK